MEHILMQPTITDWITAISTLILTIIAYITAKSWKDEILHNKKITVLKNFFSLLNIIYYPLSFNSGPLKIDMYEYINKYPKEFYSLNRKYQAILVDLKMLGLEKLFDIDFLDIFIAHLTFHASGLKEELINSDITGQMLSKYFDDKNRVKTEEKIQKLINKCETELKKLHS